MLLHACCMPRNLAIHHLNELSYLLAFVNNDSVTIINNTGNKIKEANICSVSRVAFSEDGNVLVCVTHHGMLYIIGVYFDTCTEVRIPTLQHDIIAVFPHALTASWCIVTAGQILMTHATTDVTDYVTILFSCHAASFIDVPRVTTACMLPGGEVIIIDSALQVTSITFLDTCMQYTALPPLACSPAHGYEATLSHNGELIFINERRRGLLWRRENQSLLLQITAPRIKAYQEDTDLIASSFSNDSNMLFVSNEQGGIQVYSCNDDNTWKLQHSCQTEYPTLQGEYARAATDIIACSRGVIYALDDGVYFEYLV